MSRKGKKKARFGISEPGLQSVEKASQSFAAAAAK